MWKEKGDFDTECGSLATVGQLWNRDSNSAGVLLCVESRSCEMINKASQPIYMAIAWAAFWLGMQYGDPMCYYCVYLTCVGPKNTTQILLRGNSQCCVEVSLPSKHCGHTWCTVVQ